MKEDVLFKKTPFGGFDREEVIGYIQQLKKTQQNHKTMLNQKEDMIKDLMDKNVVLADAVKKYRSENDELRCTVTKLESQLKNMKAKSVMVQDDGDAKKSGAKGKMVNDTVKMCDDLVETASATAQEMIKKAEKKLTDAENKISGVAEKLKNTRVMSSKQLAQTLEELLSGLRD